MPVERLEAEARAKFNRIKVWISYFVITNYRYRYVLDSSKWGGPDTGTGI
jgi:hypothetical protein